MLVLESYQSEELVPHRDSNAETRSGIKRAVVVWERPSVVFTVTQMVVMLL